MDEPVTKPCIYCRGEAQRASSVEHVIPECLGYKEILPQGSVCDRCNAYCSSLDTILASHPRIAFDVLLSGPPRKGGKPLSRTQDGSMWIERRRDGTKVLTVQVLDPRKHKPLSFTREGESTHFDVMGAPPRHFTAAKFSRALHKLALNAVCFWKGRDFVLDSAFDVARKFVRRPISAKEFRPYGAYTLSKGQPDCWVLMPYTHRKTGHVCWVIDIVLHHQAFSVCLSNDHKAARTVLDAHAHSNPSLTIFDTAWSAMSALPARNPHSHVKLDPAHDLEPQFRSEIREMRIALTFGPPAQPTVAPDESVERDQEIPVEDTRERRD